MDDVTLVDVCLQCGNSWWVQCVSSTCCVALSLVRLVLGQFVSRCLCCELVLVLSRFDTATCELFRSMQLYIFQSWLDSDCIREAVRAVVH
jgi:hypothetical protein